MEEKLELQKEYPEASREKLPRADALKRKIDAVAAEIDAAVYRLYGLTDEENGVVRIQRNHRFKPELGNTVWRRDMHVPATLLTAIEKEGDYILDKPTFT